eukprot:CAMPEP_0117022808 /NCGR_PEP_ID=MMETSP0472-20121206/17096_1 /TAXON_ID=693140 ORGANISM="Tiarina fusus, Strain LIS" /NCGR_SAMPLE_ID=MMETSP0472 /ASSEMBLY_ACC=CAM_ASM_000603 /LENGTH=703 /DNA_ID=CAMNT_0004728763 /DNA_START=506 /DNA_END=2618 /DNA_ORIENTATION=+
MVNGGSKSTRGKKGPRQAWDSGKSIEELEATMMKRWGTLDNPGAGMAVAAAKSSSSNNNKAKKTDTGGSAAAKFRRPVLDPWQKEEEEDTRGIMGVRGGRPSSSGGGVADDSWIMEEDWESDDEDVEYVEEYYDHDDEGYEADATSSSSSSEKSISIGHLISPRPVGGQGTRQRMLEEEAKKSDSSGSYFFNPNKATPAVENESKEGTSSQEQQQKRLSKRNNDDSSSSSKPLFDENGNKVLLTTDEALRRFEATIDAQTLQTLENSDAALPIEVASKQTWEDVGVTDPILIDNLERMYCPGPLAVQEKSTPAILTGNDLLVGTYTGSGKTLAFLVPLVQQILWSLESTEGGVNSNNNNNLGLQVIIVAPGRELASQIVTVARDLIANTPLTAQLAIGGTTFSRNLDQIRKRKPNILVGTPGRIAELAVGKPGEKRGRLNVGNLKALVMDEVDALLEYKPHRDPTRAIMQTLRRRHGDALQAILCSATATDVMDSQKVTDFLRPGYATAMADQDDVLVTKGKNKSSTKVSRTVMHGVIHVPHKRFALDTVRKLLHTSPIPQQLLIFVENARKVDIVVEKLADRGIIAAPLHGGMGSEKMDRAEVSKALREGFVGIVVATELAARGLDAPLLTHVINLDLPTDASHYAHRAGRCGRGGRPGVVINMTTNPKERNVPQRFANALGLELYDVEPRAGELVVLEKDE